MASRSAVRRVDFSQYRIGDWRMHVVARTKTLTLAAAASVAAFGIAGAQQVATAPAPTGPAVNDVAPDFALTGATRYGLLQTPVRLSDYRGSTVVLAFFFQARTKG
ncbi:MAG TPA: hypothetical protein VE110_07785 [Gemmatimonadaceae bacterium]|nr:hypothetical protein [Gemmatimonadaceae bacterium]